MSRRKLAIVAACIIVVVCGAVGSISAPGGTLAHGSSSPHIERTATVSYVVDGDTIALQGGEKIRLVGVNTPEVGSDEEPGGIEAKEFVENLCQSGTEIGLDVDDLEPKDRYGRTLAVVYVRRDGSWVNLNAELLRKGLAEVVFYPPSEFNPYEWAS